MRMRVKDRGGLEKDSKELLDFARSYLSDAFPNPERQGCPPDAALRSLAVNPSGTEAAITEHLASCSPCFRRYSELLTEVKAEREAEEGLSWKRMFGWSRTHPLLVGTALVCALIIAIGASLLFLRLRLPNAPPVDAHRTPRPVEPVSPTVAYSPFSLDLSNLSPVRGSETPTPGSQQRARVPRSPLDLTLTLPLASEERAYDVKLSTGGHTFWSKSAQAHLRHGQTLIRIEADFTQVPPGNYNLEVESSTGVRLIQPVLIEAALPKSGEPRP